MNSVPNNPSWPLRNLLTNSNKRHFLLWLTPILLIALALILRLNGVLWNPWDQVGNTLGYFHPDERSIFMRADCMYQVLAETIGYASCTTGHYDAVFHKTVSGIPNFGIFFDAERSPLNPHWFPIGSIMVYLLVAIRFAVSLFIQTDMESIALVGRTLAALADVGTVGLIYLLGKRLYGTRVGLVAMALTTFAVFHIQQSHFYRPETFTVLISLTCFWFMLNTLSERRWCNHILLGLMVGLAFAFKITSAPILLPLFIAYGYRLYQDHQTRERSISWGWSAKAWQEILAMMTVALTTFFVLSPYAFIDFSAFLNHNIHEMKIVREPGLLPYTLYYVGMPWFWYEVQQSAIWGLGVPLGIAAWGGLVHTLAINIKRPHIADVLLLSWVVLLFFSITNFEVKFLRYVFPLMPILILFSSRSLFVLLDWTRKKSNQNLARGAIALIIFIIGTTVFYGLAFEQIYAKPHPATQASNWINVNIPAGALILTDNHWDEGIPNLAQYQVKQIPMYDEDNQRKIVSLAHDLANSEYLVIYSDRLYGSITRVPERYPQSSRYYHLLFNGELGYKLEQSFTSYPELLGVAFVNDTYTRPKLNKPKLSQTSDSAILNLNLGHADQNMIDYDHPNVLIFVNEENLYQQELFDRLWATPSTTAEQPLGLMLSPEEITRQQTGGTWSELFNRESLSNRFPIIVWLLLIEGIALLTLPLAFRIFPMLPDQGYLLAKPLGILLIAYLTWLFASVNIMGFSRSSIFAAILILAIISGFIALSYKAHLIRVIREQWRLFALSEAIFLVAFIAFLALRMFNPDLWHPFRGGEKPMDFAYLNAIIRSSSMPPYDPWFAGGYLNYYYFGQFIIATLVKFSGIIPEIAYNLAVPLLYALTLSLAFSLVYNLASSLQRDTSQSDSFQLQPLVAGLTAALFVGVLANLEGAVQLTSGIWNTITAGGGIPSFDFWQSSRAIMILSTGDCALATKECASITEFPFFSFLFADLHAHLISMPFSLLVIGFSMALVLGPLRNTHWQTYLSLFLLLALTVGSLQAINAWDYPTFLLISIGALFLAEYTNSKKMNRKVLRRASLWSVLLFCLSIFLFLPYSASHETFNIGVHGSIWQTPLYVYLAIHAVFIFLITTFLAEHVYRLMFPRQDIRLWQRNIIRVICTPSLLVAYSAILIIPLLTISLLGALGYGTVAFLFLLLIVSLCLGIYYLTTHHPGSPHTLFVLMLIVIAFGLGISTDLITVNEDIDRMNTVFKLYLQSWLLLALASAFCLGRILFIWDRSRGLQRIGRRIWFSILVLLLMGGLVYPILGTPSRLADRFEKLPATLDGTVFMRSNTYIDEHGSIELNMDNQAIQWIQENIVGSPVILEATTPYYRWGSRISVYTGLPTVLGWDWHQTQQRWDYRWAIEQRKEDIQRIYSTESQEEALHLLKAYGVKYIYVGPVERIYYPETGLEKFSAMDGTSLELVYPSTSSGNLGVEIYRVL